jgi:hypothetical protein
LEPLQQVLTLSAPMPPLVMMLLRRMLALRAGRSPE